MNIYFASSVFLGLILCFFSMCKFYKIGYRNMSDNQIYIWGKFLAVGIALIIFGLCWIE